MSARAPAHVRHLLRKAIQTLDRGPSRALRGQGEGEDYRRGMDAESDDQRAWRESWITPELRAVLAYLDGANTCAEIRDRHLGRDHGVAKELDCEVTS